MIVAFGAAMTRFYRVLRPVWAAPAVNRYDRPLDRIRGLLLDVGLHRRLLKVRFSGILHALMFTGFIVLLSATLQSFGEGFFPGFSLAAIGGDTWLATLQEVFALGIIVALAMAIFQRAILRPKRFVTSKKSDAWIIYALVTAVVVSLLMDLALRQAISGHPSGWRPVSSFLAQLVMQSGLSPDAVRLAQGVSYWVHILSILAFLVYIPGSKHRHIFTAIPNIYFRALDRASELPPPPPGAAASGVSKIGDFNWKHKLDLLSCTECGRCEAACPANHAGLPLSPKLIVMDLRDHMFEDAGRTDRGGTNLVGDVISQQTLFACTTCRACMDVCPVRIEPMTKIIEMRRTAVEAGNLEPMLQEALGNFQRTGNSMGKPARQRARWTQGLPFKIKDARKEPVDILWFVGDHASYDPRLLAATRNVASLLNAAGVDFGLLYEAEQNAGNDVRRIGEEGGFETLARANIEALTGCEYRRILTTDPHTLNALRNDYLQFGVTYNVVHYTELLLELIEAGQLSVTPGNGETVTYHDPCYLGRYNGVFDAPRELIRKSGYRLRDMARCRENSFCCGAGGGRIWMSDSDIKERPSENRIKEALALGDARSFIVACPKDMIMYSAAVQSLGAADKISVKDISELIQLAGT